MQSGVVFGPPSRVGYVRDVFSPPAQRSVNSFTAIRQAAPALHNRTSDVISLAAHAPTIAIFELGLAFDPRMMPGNFVMIYLRVRELPC